MDSRLFRCRLQYHVKWRGYGVDESTWARRKCTKLARGDWRLPPSSPVRPSSDCGSLPRTSVPCVRKLYGHATRAPNNNVRIWTVRKALGGRRALRRGASLIRFRGWFRVRSRTVTLILLPYFTPSGHSVRSHLAPYIVAYHRTSPSSRYALCITIGMFIYVLSSSLFETRAPAPVFAVADNFTSARTHARTPRTCLHTLQSSRTDERYPCDQIHRQPC